MTELRVEPAPGLGVSWDADAVGAYLDAADPQPAWRLDGELPDGAAMRVLSAALEDGTLILAAAVRPAGAEGHDDLVAALVAGPEEAAPAGEALLSAEYGPDGSVRRVGIEIYRDGEDYPVRLAGDAVAAAGASCTRLEVRSAGRSGGGLFEIVAAAN